MNTRRKDVLIILGDAGFNYYDDKRDLLLRVELQVTLPKVAVNYESMFQGLVKKYNKRHKVALPKVTISHTLRHTFCTSLANAGINPKALRYILRHFNIAMTLNYYAYTTSDSAVAEMERLIT